MRPLVVGSGAIGLRTAVELIRNKIPVTLRSPISPLHPNVCSVGAGGLWMPFHCDDPRVDNWSIDTLNELWKFGKDKTKLKKGSSTITSERPLVEIMTAISLKNSNADITKQTSDTKVTYTDTNELPTWTKDSRLEFQQLTVEMLCWQNIVKKLKIPTESQLKDAGYNHAWMFQTPIVDAPQMLQHMLNELVEDPNSDINIETNEYYESIQEMKEVARSLNCDTVINCTGLNSQSICNDPDVVGGRGVLLQYDRNNCPRLVTSFYNEAEGLDVEMIHDAVILTENLPWGNNKYPCYMIPRGNLINIGGCYIENDTEETLREKEKQQLLKNAYNLGIDTNQVDPVGEWVGYRPYRSIVRCEEEEMSGGAEDNDVRVIHNYGHGGSGWTVNVGAAKEVVHNILLKK